MNQSFHDMGFTHRFEKGHSNLTLLMLHGTGGDEDDLVSLGRALAPDASMLSPRGKVLENGMPRFFRRLAEGVFDVEDLKVRSRELADFVKVSSVKYRFDPQSVVPVGYSNGANIAAAMLLMGSLLPAGAVLFRPMVPLSPSASPGLKQTPVFISAGMRDQIVPRGDPERLARLLEVAGAEVTLNWADGTHALTEQEVKRAADWLHQNFTS